MTGQGHLPIADFRKSASVADVQGLVPDVQNLVAKLQRRGFWTTLLDPAAPLPHDAAGLAIMGPRLTADWVILSACNTAAGDGAEGATGLSGLARALFYAGAHDLLVSHWAVHDDVAAQITAEAIRLKRSDPSLSRAGALQRAIRAVRDDPENDFPASIWAHPSAWAPYSLVGIGD